MPIPPIPGGSTSKSQYPEIIIPGSAGPGNNATVTPDDGYIMPAPSQGQATPNFGPLGNAVQDYFNSPYLGKYSPVGLFADFASKALSTDAATSAGQGIVDGANALASAGSTALHKTEGFFGDIGHAIASPFESSPASHPVAPAQPKARPTEVMSATSSSRAPAASAGAGHSSFAPTPSGGAPSLAEKLVHPTAAAPAQATLTAAHTATGPKTAPKVPEQVTRAAPHNEARVTNT